MKIWNGQLLLLSALFKLYLNFNSRGAGAGTFYTIVVKLVLRIGHLSV